VNALLGLSPGTGGTRRLPRAVGKAFLEKRRPEFKGR